MLRSEVGIRMIRQTMMLLALLGLAARIDAQLPVQAKLAQIDRTFVCPESLPSDSARQAALQLFLEQVSAVEPNLTVANIITYRVSLLRKHRCAQTLANIARPLPSTAQKNGPATRLSLPVSQTRPAGRNDDWVQLIPAASAPPGVEDCDRPILSKTVRSLDGGYVYQQVCRWVTSGDIIQVRLSDGRRKEVTAGNSLAVIRNGPWRGYLLVSKHKYKLGNQGGSYDATWVVRPDGKEMFAVPGTDDGDEAQVSAWLRSKGWIAN